MPQESRTLRLSLPGAEAKSQAFFSHFPLTLDEIIDALRGVTPKTVVFEGWEPTLDPHLSKIATELHREIGTCNYLLTNGHILPELEGIDQVKVSIKALSDGIHRNIRGNQIEGFWTILESFTSVGLS